MPFLLGEARDGADRLPARRSARRLEELEDVLSLENNRLATPRHRVHRTRQIGLLPPLFYALSALYAGPPSCTSGVTSLRGAPPGRAKDHGRLPSKARLAGRYRDDLHRWGQDPDYTFRSIATRGPPRSRKADGQPPRSFPHEPAVCP